MQLITGIGRIFSILIVLASKGWVLLCIQSTGEHTSTKGSHSPGLFGHIGGGMANILGNPAAIIDGLQPMGNAGQARINAK